jgi:hypothetical protein
VEDLQRVAHSLGEVVGLGLRNPAHCPVELNLMPESTLKWQSFNQKKPYFIATVFSMVLVIWAMGYLFDKLAVVKNDELEKVKAEVVPEQQKEVLFNKVRADLKKVEQDKDQIVSWMDDRYYWADVLSEVRQALIRVEQGTKVKLHTDAGVWLEQMTSATPKPEGDQSAAPGPAPVMSAAEGAAAEAFKRRYGLDRGAPQPPPPDAGAPVGVRSKKAKAAAGTNEIATVTLAFRGVSLTGVSGQPEANKGIAYDVLKELQSSPVFDAEETKTPTDVTLDEQTGTFTFSIVAQLKRPLKL